MISKDIVGIFSFWVNWILLLDRSLEPEKSLLNLSNTSYLGGCINRRISLFEYFTSCWFLKIILKLTHKWKRHGEKNFCEQSTGSFRKHIIMIIISTWLFWETDCQSPLSFMHPTCVSLRYAHPVSISRHRTWPLQFYRWQIFAVEKQSSYPLRCTRAFIIHCKWWYGPGGRLEPVFYWIEISGS